MKRRLRVVAAALFDEVGRVLIAQRPEGKHMAGWWEFPGGKVSNGETDAAALVRELREELGIESRPDAVVMALTHDYPDRVVELVLWRATITQGVPRSLDGQALKWVERQSLGNERLLPADEPFIAALQDLVPDRVLALLANAGALNDSSLGIQLLDAAASADHTSKIRAKLVFEKLGMIVLDNDTGPGPYCYVSRGVAAGMIVHLTHLEPCIKFQDLDAFESFLLKLREVREPIWTMDIEAPAHPDQAALRTRLHELASSPLDDQAESEIMLYLPLVRSDSTAVLARLSRSKSFFIREAVATVIGKAELNESYDLLRTLKGDDVPQVRYAAERGLRGWNAGRRRNS